MLRHLSWIHHIERTGLAVLWAKFRKAAQKNSQNFPIYLKDLCCDMSSCIGSPKTMLASHPGFEARLIWGRDVKSSSHYYKETRFQMALFIHLHSHWWFRNDHMKTSSEMSSKGKSCWPLPVLLESAKGMLLDFCITFDSPCLELGCEATIFNGYHSLRPHSGGTDSVLVMVYNFLTAHYAYE